MKESRPQRSCVRATNEMGKTQFQRRQFKIRGASDPSKERGHADSAVLKSRAQGETVWESAEDT